MLVQVAEQTAMARSTQPAACDMGSQYGKTTGKRLGSRRKTTAW